MPSTQRPASSNRVDLSGAREQFLSRGSQSRHLSMFGRFCMHLFRIRLILALIAGVTLISVASTYFDVLAHKHALRVELTNRTRWMGMSIERDLARALQTGDISSVRGLAELLKSGTGALALAVYDANGSVLASTGPETLLENLPDGLIKKSIKNGS